MQNIRYVLLILAIFLYGAYSLYRLQRNQAFENRLHRVLKEEGYKKFCEMLESKEGKRVYSIHEAYLIQLKAAINNDVYDDAKRLIEELAKFPMKERDFINYNMDTLNYAVTRQDAELADRVCETLKKKRRYAKYYQEAVMTRDIYILHQANHIDELLQFAKTVKNPSSQAMAYYRIAKQYFYLGDKQKVREYLGLSVKAFPDKTWQKVIKDTISSNYEKLK